MKYYIKKFIPIAAVQYHGKFDGEFKKEFFELLSIAFTLSGHAENYTYFPDEGKLVIHTLEGDVTATHGCYIICGVRGELYPCQEDTFNETYQEVL